jgi:hypothetical protein
MSSAPQVPGVEVHEERDGCAQVLPEESVTLLAPLQP